MWSVTRLAFALAVFALGCGRTGTVKFAALPPLLPIPPAAAPDRGRDVFMAAPGAEAAPNTGKLSLHFIDVKQGDATLIECPNGKQILMDAGRLPYENGAAIREYVLKYLNKDAPRLDALVVSHPDADHYNILPEVLADVQIDAVLMVGDEDDYTAVQFIDWLEDSVDPDLVQDLPVDYHDPVDTPNATLDCGAATVHVLAANVQSSYSAKNTASIVLMVTMGDFNAILTADATKDTEAKIISWYPAAWLRADVLKMGHHGSASTSTTDAWASTVRPTLAFASAGYTNSYGHPRKVIFERLEPFTETVDGHRVRWATSQTQFQNRTNYTEALYSTATQGTIVVTSDGTGYSVAFEK